jgi:undecaprenyl-diphosphatase
LELWHALVLGIIQGITEFLPVSSSGHLVFLHDIFGTAENTLAFDAVLQMASIFAVLIYFRRDIATLINVVLRRMSRLPVNQKEITLAYALMIGTIPAVILGLLLESYMETAFRNPLLVAVVFIVGSLLFVWAEYSYKRTKRDDTMSVYKGVQIGLFQCLALIPGMSRSGASIAGGMLLGLSRVEAARFSFLLAIPIIAGSGAKKLIDLLASNGNGIEWGSLILAAAVSFVASLLTIHFLLAFVRRHTLWPFIWYRVILAIIVIIVILVLQN